jgi:Family of unknown function (DUF5996)
MTSDWPELTLSEWGETRETLLIWTQIVGKIRLALAPMVNHWWQVPFYVSARGLTTSLMHSGGKGVEAEFDFVDHVLELRTSTGDRRTVKLEPRTVASFYAATTSALDDLGIAIDFYEKPVEMPVAIRFPDDEEHRSYDADAVQRYWLALLQAHRVMSVFRGRFVGKASPVHYFWGAGDLAATRFSGRDAPKHPGGVPNCPDIVQELAYDRELSSCGFWAGGSDEGSFYSYAYPEPAGFADWPIGPGPAHYDPGLGEFLLPYKEVRLSADPDSMLLEFLQSTYEAAAELAKWDRQALEPQGGGRSG